ncbi:MAG: PKD domain-containing protein [Candidatus Binatia bacterium]
MTTPLGEPSHDELLAAVPQELLDEPATARSTSSAWRRRAGPRPRRRLRRQRLDAVNATIASWAWDFGDGTSGTGAVVNHTYDTPGEYFASLTVTDTNGRVNLVPLQHLITVEVPPAPSPSPVPTEPPSRRGRPVRHRRRLRRRRPRPTRRSAS